MNTPHTLASPRASLLALSFAYFLLGTASLAVIGLLGPMAKDLNVTKVDIAQMVTVFALTFAVAAPLLQVISGTLPRRTLFMGGLAALAAGAFLTALSSTYALAMASRFVMALGAAAVGPLASAIGTTLVRPDQQGKALATVFGGMTFATVLGVPLSSWLGGALGWRLVFAVLGVLAAATLLVSAALLKDRSASAPLRLRDLFGVLKNAAVASGVAITFVQMAAQFVTYALAAPFLEGRFHVPQEAVSIALLVFGIGGVIGNAFASKLDTRFGSAATVGGALIALAGVFAALVFGPANAWFAVCLLGLWAVAAMVFQVPHQKRLIGLAPDVRHLILALNASALYLGMSAGAATGAQAYRQLGAAELPIISIAFLIAALRVSLRAEKRRQHARWIPA